MMKALSWLFLLCLVTLAFSEYRSFNGEGNKIGRALGVPDKPFLRGAFGGAEYRGRLTYEADGQSPKTIGLRGAREISNIVSGLKEQSIPEDDNQVSLMHTVWGQFIDHDIIRSPPGNEQWTIAVPQNDPVYGGIANLIPFQRSVWVNSSTVREQINTVTSYIDASNIYGNSLDTHNYLRANGQCEMIITSGPDGSLPPKDTFEYMENLGNTLGIADPTTLFLVGDARGNENPALLAINTLFLREHNRLCKAFETSIPDTESRFQTARKWVIALIQQVTFNEYIPSTLGNPLTPWSSYDDTVDPTIDSFFAQAAFRFGYSESTDIPIVDTESLEQTTTLPLVDNLFNPDYVAKNGVDKILAGLGRTVQSRADPFFPSALRSSVFGRNPRSTSKSNVQLGIDIAATLIQRARDHGIPRYNDMREYFGLARRFEFSEITSDPRLAIALELAYPGGVDTIDAFIGGLSEDRVAPSHLGPLFTASIQEQFMRLRDGDRFYFENMEASGFTIEEIAQIKQTKLSDIILKNTQMKRVQCSLFYAASSVDELNCGEATYTNTQTHLLAEKDATLSFQEIGEDKIKFSVRAKHNGWIAVGIPFSQTSPRMLGSDAIIGYFHPSGQGIVEDYRIGLLTQDISCPDGVCYDTNTMIGGHDDVIGGAITRDGEFMTLQFTRLRNTNDTVGDIAFAAKGEDQVILLAMGEVTSMGRLGYHQHFKTFLTVGPKSASVDIATTTTTEKQPTTAESTTADQELTDSYQFTSPITSIDGVDIYWTPYENTVEIAVSSPIEGYVSLGFTGPQNDGMLGSLAVIGWAGTAPKIATYYLGSYEVSGIKETQELNITNSRVSFMNGQTVIQFTIPIDGTYVQKSGKPTQVISAVCTGCYSIQEHTAHTSKPVQIDFVSGAVKDAPFAWTPLHTHGLMMTLAWAVGVPIAVLYARYGKAHAPTWFKVHMWANIVSYLVSIGGLIAAIVYFAGFKLDRAHNIMGLIIMILATLQALYGLLRPHVPAKGDAKSIPRIIFEVVHSWQGRFLLVAATVNIFLGLMEIMAPMELFYAFGAYVVFVVVLIIILELYKRCRLDTYQLAETSSPIKIEMPTLTRPDGFEKT